MGLSKDPAKAANQLKALAAGRVAAARKALADEEPTATAKPREKSPSARAVERVDFSGDELKTTRVKRQSGRKKAKEAPTRRQPARRSTKRDDDESPVSPEPHVAEDLPGFLEGALAPLGLGGLLRRSRG